MDNEAHTMALWLVGGGLALVTGLICLAVYYSGRGTMTDEEAILLQQERERAAAAAYWAGIEKRAQAGDPWARAEMDAKRRADYLAAQIAASIPPPPKPQDQLMVGFIFPLH